MLLSVVMVLVHELAFSPVVETVTPIPWSFSTFVLVSIMNPIPPVKIVA